MYWHRKQVQVYKSLDGLPDQGIAGVWYIVTESTTPYLWDGTQYKSITVGDLVASGVLNDSNVGGQTVKDALNTLLTDIENIPTGLTWRGLWDANLNEPEIKSGVGVLGWYYKVVVPGKTEIDGIDDWEISDWVIYNGEHWQKIDNSDSVTSVVGRKGDVDLYTDDIENKSDLPGSTSTEVFNYLSDIFKKPEIYTGNITEENINNSNIVIPKTPYEFVSVQFQGLPIQLKGVTYQVLGNNINLEPELVNLLELNQPYQIIYWLSERVVEPQIENRVLTNTELINKAIILAKEPKSVIQIYFSGYPVQVDTFTVSLDIVRLSDDLVNVLAEGVPYQVVYWV